MHLGLVSTWSSRCGIATYSHELTAALQAQGVQVTVLAPIGEDPGTGPKPPPGLRVERCWRLPATTGYLDAGIAPLPDVALAASRLGCDVVHVQHEHGLFPHNAEFLELLRVLQVDAGIPSVCTLHTVFPYGDRHATPFYRPLAQRATAVIVHTTAQQVPLICAKANVTCIPHGTAQRAYDEKATRRLWKRLDLPARPLWAVAFGFISSGKNAICTLNAWAELQARDILTPDAALLIIGDVKDRDYAIRLRHVAAVHEPYAFVRFEFVEDIAAVLGGADLAILNTTNLHALSASGQVHACASCRTPLVTAEASIYSDALAAGQVTYNVDLRDVEAPSIRLLNAITAVTRSALLRKQLSARIGRYAATTSWERVASRTKRVYETVLAKEGQL